ncbi:MAG: HAD family phosphatase [Actinomycetota bacterium]|nr:HAD family phosphatase [Actinomycetota bacterium]
MPRPIVFDCDGVLLDTEAGWTRAETELFARYGHSYGEEEKRRLIGLSLPKAGREFAEMLDEPGRGDELMDEAIELVAKDLSNGVEPMPGARRLLADVRGTRPMAVASNSYRRLVDLALEVSGFAAFFDVVVTGDEIEHPKPAPDIYLEACRRLGVDPRTAAAVEDSPAGVASAKAAGLYVIGVPYLAGLDLSDADLQVESLEAPAVRAALG